MNEPVRVEQLTYALALAACVVISVPMLISMPGPMQVLYLTGLFIVVVVYPWFPQLAVIYGTLPFFYAMFGQWVYLPQFVRAWADWVPGTKWVFEFVAILGLWRHIVASREMPASPKGRKEEYSITY